MSFDDSLLVPLFGIAALVWMGIRTVRYGSVAGSMFGARSAGELGRIQGRARGARRVTVAVHRLEDAPKRAVGIQFTGKSATRVSRQAGSVSRDDARRLAELLERAVAEQDAT